MVSIEKEVHEFDIRIDKAISNINYELLAKHAKNYGGLLSNFRDEFPNFEEQGPILIEGYKNLNYIKKLPEVHFGIVDSLDFNARAIKSEIDNQYIILLNKGLLKEFDSINLGIQNISKDKFYIQNPLWLTILFQNLVFEHELSHVLYGHLDWLKEIRSLNLLSEDNKSENLNPKLNYKIQTLEMIADNFSQARIYGWLNNIATNQLIPHIPNYRYQILESLSDSMMCFYALNKLYFNLKLETETKGKNTHLTPRERIVISFHHILTGTKKLEIDIDKDKLIEKSIDKIKMIELFFRDEFGTPMNADFWDSKNRYLKLNEFCLSLLNNWKAIKPELNKYTYFKMN